MKSFQQTRRLLGNSLKGTVDSACVLFSRFPATVYTPTRALPGLCCSPPTSCFARQFAHCHSDTNHRRPFNFTRGQGRTRQQARRSCSALDQGTDCRRDASVIRPNVLTVFFFLPIRPIIIQPICSEHLKSVPEILESLMSEKRLLQAAVLLVRSLKTIGRPDMLEIGAVSDLRTYLTGQETVSHSELH